jgi:hypothetical protein
MKNSAFTQEVETRLWMPGTAAADSRIRKVAKAVERYDEALRFGRHEITGDWVVCMGEDSHPIFGFGRELPNPDDVERILSEKDIARRGSEILKELADAAEKRRNAESHTLSEKTAIAAEHFEHAFRRIGKHPTPRVFVPRSIPRG